MIVIKLKEAMLDYGRRARRKITYEKLADMTGIPVETLRSIGSRPGYHPTIARIETLCRALDVTPGDLLELIDDPPQNKPKAKSSKSNKRKKAAK